VESAETTLNTPNNHHYHHLHDISTMQPHYQNIIGQR